MAPSSINAHFEEGTLAATLTFGKLPPKVETVRLEVPADAVREMNGVEVEAMRYVIGDPLINFTLSVTPTEPNVSLGSAILGEYDWVSLTDENGHTYPLSQLDSDRPNGPSTPVLDAAGRPVVDPSGRAVFDGLGREYNVAFVGPLGKFGHGEQFAIVRIEPKDGVIRFEWVNPFVTVTGPWVIKVPLSH